MPCLPRLCAVACNLAFIVVLHSRYGYRVLALGTAIAAMVNSAILYIAFHYRVHPFRHGRLVAFALRIGAAVAVMGVSVWGSYRGLGEWVGTSGLGGQTGRGDRSGTRRRNRIRCDVSPVSGC